MTKKGHPNIPDFSQRKPSKNATPGPTDKQGQRVPQPKPIAKPQATSQKSGRRGQ